MTGLTLADSLRYLFTGLIPLLFLYIAERGLVLGIIEELGPIGVSLGAAALGSLLYHLYRPTLYRYVFAPLQDSLRRTTHSPRTYLASRYNLSGGNASLLWAFVANRVLSDAKMMWRRQASATHLLYISSFVGLALALSQAVLGQWGDALIMLVIGSVLGVGGVIHDRLAEDYEYLSCRALDLQALDDLASEYGFTPDQTDTPT